MNKIKVYIAGRNSGKGTPFWRDTFCRELEAKSGIGIINLDPTSRKDMDFDPDMIFGRDAFLIKSADLVIVNLTDDTGVGAAQEMLLAKYFRKPLVGIAEKGGKFVGTEREDLGRTVENFIHPFVAVPCDAVVDDIMEAADWIRNDMGRVKPKGMECIENSMNYYAEKYHGMDRFVKELGLPITKTAKTKTVHTKTRRAPAKTRRAVHKKTGRKVITKDATNATAKHPRKIRRTAGMRRKAAKPKITKPKNVKPKAPAKPRPPTLKERRLKAPAKARRVHMRELHRKQRLEKARLEILRKGRVKRLKDLKKIKRAKKLLEKMEHT